MPVTMQTIADRVGVTRATVSMALRNDPRISAPRRKQIREVADELGYRPNALVSSLMSHLSQTRTLPQHTSLLYLVTGKNSSVGTPGSTMDLYFRGAVERAAQLGYHLEPLWIREPGLTEARLAKILWVRKTPGIIIAPKQDEFPLPNLPWERLSSVTIGHSFSEPRLDRVLPNYFTASKMAVAFIKRNLHAPVRLILPDRHDRNVFNLWKASYLNERQGESDLHPPLIIDSPERAIDWVRKHRGGTVLGTNLVLTWLQEAGLRAPEDFHFISLNTENRPGLIGIREPNREVGGVAADLVVSRINMNRPGIPDTPRVTLVEPGWQGEESPRDRASASDRPLASPSRIRST